MSNKRTNKMKERNRSEFILKVKRATKKKQKNGINCIFPENVTNVNVLILVPVSFDGVSSLHHYYYLYGLFAKFIR